MSKIRIFNPKSNHEILIETSMSWVFFHPRTYDEHPYFEIKLLNGFNLMSHASSCLDCDAFIKSLGTDTVNWYLEYDNCTYRLNLEKLGTDTKLKYINSFYEFGTVLQLRIHEIPVDIKGLNELREVLVSNNEFEKACIIRDLIKDTIG